MPLSPPTPRPASRRCRLFFVFASLLTALVLAGLPARPAQASTTVYYAATNGLSTNSGLSWSSPRDFVSALAGAASGDQVWVKKGTYTGNFTATDGVAVYGGFNGTETSIGQRNITANVTILDGNNSGTVYAIPSAATKTNTFDGFTVQHGASSSGGGLSNSSNDTIVIANCTFTNNSETSASGAGYGGGGVNGSGGTVSLTNCMFLNNTAAASGGGVYVNGGKITAVNCIFMNNSGGYGGGFDAPGATTTVTNCIFTNNKSTDVGSPAGGIYVGGSTTATISACSFTGNSAVADGGGVYNNGAIVTIADCMFDSNSAAYGGGAYTNNTIAFTNCTFMSNSATGDGGGVYGTGGTATVTGCIFRSNTASGTGGGICGSSGMLAASRCTFISNSGIQDGGGIYASVQASLSDCTFSDNSPSEGYGGGGVFAANTATIVRCEFSGNGVDAIYLFNTGSSSTPSLIKDNLITGTGTGNSNPVGVHVDAGNSGNTSYVTLANNTIVKTNVGIDFESNSGAISVANNIFDHNDGGLNVASSVPTVTLSHNDFFNNVGYNAQGATLSATDLMVDPLFVNSGSGDYHLTLGSPMIDAGDDSYVVHGDTDLDDHPRIMGASVDIGTYEGTESAILKSISPAAVQAGSAAFTLTLTGTYFLNTSVVDWNGTALTTTYVSATEITASVPASLVATAGSATVTVANPGAYPSNSKTIAINPVATLTSLSPMSAPAGSAAFTLTVTGTKFVTGAIVDWNGAALATTFGSATQLTASVPVSDLSATGTASVTAVNPGTAASNALTFTITTAPAPTITSFTPTSGLVGSVVTITGTNLAGVTAIRFHNANATTFSPNAAGTQINILVPTGAATGTITVTTPGGSVKTATNFTVLVPPTITSFTPTSGPVGTVITITGTNLSGATRVRFHNANAVTYSANADGTQLTVTVPTGAGTGTITVDTPGGQVTSAGTFTVTTAPAPPTVTSFTPTSGPIGTVVTVTGTNLNGVTGVRFHNANASVFSANGAGTQLTVTVPTGAGTGTFSITTPGGTVKTTGTFTVN